MKEKAKAAYGAAASRCPLIRVSALILISMFSAVAQATSVQSYMRNREGLSEFEKESYFSAYKAFVKAIEEDPMNPELQLNLARTFEANEQYEQAEQSYRAALSLLPKDSKLRFEALFNWAGVLAKLSRIDEALAAYQQALEMDPDSIEVKTNIELLWQGGGGGGDGESKNQQEQGEQEKGQGQSQQPQQEKKQKKPKFESQELSPQNVKRILDEIKNQEQNIRAQEYDKGAKDSPKAKDW